MITVLQPHAHAATSKTNAVNGILFMIILSANVKAVARVPRRHLPVVGESSSLVASADR